MSAELSSVVAVIVLLLGVYVSLAIAGARRSAPRTRTQREVSGKKPLVSPPATDTHAPSAREERPPTEPAEPTPQHHAPRSDDAGDGALPGEQNDSIEPARPIAPTILLRGPVSTRFPLVFAHGWLGFDTIGVRGLRQEYFRGVRNRLEALGYKVYFARVSPTASIERRAVQLAEQVKVLRADRVNIVAHSMGGLDARFAIARLGLHTKVASLTTIGTPHRGTPLADSGAWLLGDFRSVRRALSVVGVDGLYDLTTRRMNDFNRIVQDAPSVAYASVIGTVTQGASNVHAVLSPAYAYLLRKAGENDGIVPAHSQRWGDVIGTVEADHWAQIGWSAGFDARAFYAQLAEDLAHRGL